MISDKLFINCLFIFFVITKVEVNGKILSECEAARELKNSGISATFISNWVCLMKSESGLNTSLVKGPGTMSSYSYGVFQINSYKWCKRGRKGGECNAKCEDFADDDITDDIACAKKIQSTEGFKHWTGWLKKCYKNEGALPDVSGCKSNAVKRHALFKRFLNFFAY
ncbi:lysozyme C, milk isozyme isoform X1 [Microplitis demolitor]|uniref:lysozyme C, milk isozyme isoform X1 n=1 Tax=Microplitis demolitor TaxID=69319 RepID=UPI0004CCF214|nr:lysozyme C, milk isozyme isoform X1 [Microplitis demolitor]